MHLAIVHFHLSRGGVTQAIWNHLRAVLGQSRAAPPRSVVLLHGGRREELPGDLAPLRSSCEITQAIVPELAYDEGVAIAAQPRALAERLTQLLADSGGDPDNTVVHFHNHALGKNLSLPGAVWALAERGFAMLLQIHDFAEDYRPALYQRLHRALSPDAVPRLPDRLYPQAPHIHYAVLNGRDLGILPRGGRGHTPSLAAQRGVSPLRRGGSPDRAAATCRAIRHRASRRLYSLTGTCHPPQERRGVAGVGGGISEHDRSLDARSAEPARAAA